MGSPVERVISFKLLLKAQGKAKIGSESTSQVST